LECLVFWHSGQTTKEKQQAQNKWPNENDKIKKNRNMWIKKTKIEKILFHSAKEPAKISDYESCFD
jgi:hypothetical protein